jgi:FtsH-binding integral membrane protein
MYAILALSLLAISVFSLLVLFHYVKDGATGSILGLALFVCLVASAFCFARAGIDKGHAEGYKQGQIDAKNGIWKVEWTMTGTWTTTQPIGKD